MSPVCRSLAQIGLVVLISLLLISPRAKADAEDTFTITPGVAVQHDDNLFRLSSSADPNAVLGRSTKSDDIITSSLALKIDKSYSLQRFELDASLADYRYRNFDFLNFTARNYAAAWRWSLTPYFHGNLTSDRNETLNSFTEVTTGFRTRNLRTDENQRFDGILEVSGSWRVLGGVAQTTRTNSQVFEQEADSRLNFAEGGLRYDFPSGSSLSYIARSGRGEYTSLSQPSASLAFFDTGFDQRENEVRLIWPVTGKTTIDARAAYMDRSHDHFSERDFAGGVGNLNVKWEITGKTALTAGLSRELTSYQTDYSSYIRIDHFVLSPVWQISEKTALRGRYDYAKLDYRGAIAVTPFNGRADTQRTAALVLEWQPLRSLSLNATLQNDRRTSNIPGFDFESMMAGVSAQMTF
jgi:exopolysaccharide biosynthesis operon protein EpsL